MASGATSYYLSTLAVKNRASIIEETKKMRTVICGDKPAAKNTLTRSSLTPESLQADVDLPFLKIFSSKA